MLVQCISGKHTRRNRHKLVHDGGSAWSALRLHATGVDWGTTGTTQHDVMGLLTCRQPGRLAMLHMFPEVESSNCEHTAATDSGDRRTLRNLGVHVRLAYLMLPMTHMLGASLGARGVPKIGISVIEKNLKKLFTQEMTTAWESTTGYWADINWYSETHYSPILTDKKWNLNPTLNADAQGGSA